MAHVRRTSVTCGSCLFTVQYGSPIRGQGSTREKDVPRIPSVKHIHGIIQTGMVDDLPLGVPSRRVWSGKSSLSKEDKHTLDRRCESNTRSKMLRIQVAASKALEDTLRWRVSCLFQPRLCVHHRAPDIQGLSPTALLLSWLLPLRITTTLDQPVTNLPFPWTKSYCMQLSVVDDFAFLELNIHSSTAWFVCTQSSKIVSDIWDVPQNPRKTLPLTF